MTIQKEFDEYKAMRDYYEYKHFMSVEIQNNNDCLFEEVVMPGVGWFLIIFLGIIPWATGIITIITYFMEKQV